MRTTSYGVLKLLHFYEASSVSDSGVTEITAAADKATASTTTAATATAAMQLQPQLQQVQL